ncbi:transposase [Sinorhizobium meliloti]|uniref:transposase n=1 Tax=Rhizobium meliloti TaxID=382 RepID=UPI003B51F71B
MRRSDSAHHARWGRTSGLTPKKYQSGETDLSCRISKIGDGSVRTALYEAANVIRRRPVKGSDLKGRALAVARGAGPRTARGANLKCSLRPSTDCGAIRQQAGKSQA